MANLRNGIVIVALIGVHNTGGGGGETRNKVTRDVVAEPGRILSGQSRRRQRRKEGRKEEETIEGTATNIGQLS